MDHKLAMGSHWADCISTLIRHRHNNIKAITISILLTPQEEWIFSAIQSLESSLSFSMDNIGLVGVLVVYRRLTISTEDWSIVHVSIRV